MLSLFIPARNALLLTARKLHCFSVLHSAKSDFFTAHKRFLHSVHYRNILSVYKNLFRKFYICYAGFELSKDMSFKISGAAQT